MKTSEVRITKDLSAFFSPGAIAIIGASSDPTKIGGRPIRNLQLAHFGGNIYPINPRVKDVQGLRAYESLEAVGCAIDLAIVAVPAAQVPAAIESCASVGCRSAAVFSSGFSETNEEGAKLQRLILAIARPAHIQILGPNCMGTISTRTGTLATFSSVITTEAPKVGRISLASQSGAFGSHCFALMRQRGLALNLWATTGNQCDLEVSDFLSHMIADPASDVVVACIEGLNDADKLMRAFAQAREFRKPLIVMKVGRSDVGAAAVASHTASLAGSDAVFDAVVREYGVHRAHTIDELIDVTYACANGRFPKGRDLGVVTVSGGVGVLIADAAADVGLDVSPLDESAQMALRDLVPFAGTRNPIDVTAQILSNPDLIEPMLSLLVQRGGYSSILLFLAHLGLNPPVMEKLLPGLRRVAQRFPDRYLSISLLADPSVRSTLEGMGFNVFEDPTRAVRAINALTRFTQSFMRPPRNRAAGEEMPLVRPQATFNEYEAKRLLARAGIPSCAEALVTNAEAAAAAAKGFGFPAVMKIVSRDITHKSDMGGVVLGVKDELHAKTTFVALMERATRCAPGARIDGVLVSATIRDAVETVAGVFIDETFGPVVMFGLGGIFVEVLGDVVFRPAPFALESAREMVNEVKGVALLEGARGRPIADKEALAQILVQLSMLASANAATIASIDINPLMVLPIGQGAYAVDAVIETKPGGSEGH